MLTDHAGLSRFERLLGLITRVRPGEGRRAFLFFLHGFLLLSSYQIVKALREALILTKFSAEVRAYAVAAMALVLIFVGAKLAVSRFLEVPALVSMIVVLLLLARSIVASIYKRRKTKGS